MDLGTKMWMALTWNEGQLGLMLAKLPPLAGDFEH